MFVSKAKPETIFLIRSKSLNEFCVTELIRKIHVHSPDF